MGGPVGIGGGGIGTIIIVLMISWLTGVNPLSLLNMTGGGPAKRRRSPRSPPGSGGDDPQSRFISVVLADMEDTWTEVFAKSGERYQPPVLVLFNEMVQSACGSASAATGAVLLPGDSKVYLDLSFFRELDAELRRARRLRAGVRRGPRSRPSRPERARRERAGLAPAATGVEGRGQRAIGAAGTAGGLLRRRVGSLRRAAGHAGSGRRGRRPAGRRRDRRRPPPATESGPRRAGELHARLVEQRAQWLRQGLSNGRIEECDTFRK